MLAAVAVAVGMTMPSTIGFSPPSSSFSSAHLDVVRNGDIAVAVAAVETEDEDDLASLVFVPACAAAAVVLADKNDEIVSQVENNNNNGR